MQNSLVIDIGNTKIKAGYFKQDTLVEVFSCETQGPFKEDFVGFLSKSPADEILLSSVSTRGSETVQKILREVNRPFRVLDFSKLKLKLDVDEKEQLGHDRIANAYGALHRFPQYDCIIVDIGTGVTFDLVTKEGCYKGGAIYPGMEISARSLAEYTDRLPLVSVQKPPSPLAKTTETHIQSGIYYGLLGAIERIVFELRQLGPLPISVQVLATGGALQTDALISDVQELVDVIDPHLTLIGLHEILKELTP